MSDTNPKVLHTIRELSERLVRAQRPIRILEAVKWDDDIRRHFFNAKCQRLPNVDRDYYLSRALTYDPDDKLSELLDIDLDTKRQLGEYNPVGKIIRRMALEYADAVRMIQARGTGDFSRWSRDLYGSAHDVFYQGEPTMAEFGQLITSDLAVISNSNTLPVDEKDIEAADAVRMLQQRLNESFLHPGSPVTVKLSDGIVSDAAAGCDYIKLKADARFSERDLRLLEAHEGWVHVGTTLNGLAQPWCTFLGKGPPSSTITQEGLAIFVENLSFRSYAERVQRVGNRIRAVAMAEDRAGFSGRVPVLWQTGRLRRRCLYQRHASIPRQHSRWPAVYERYQLCKGVCAGLQLHSTGRQTRFAESNSVVVLRQGNADRCENAGRTGVVGRGGPACPVATAHCRPARPDGVDVLLRLSPPTEPQVHRGRLRRDFVTPASPDCVFAGDPERTSGHTPNAASRRSRITGDHSGMTGPPTVRLACSVARGRVPNTPVDLPASGIGNPDRFQRFSTATGGCSLRSPGRSDSSNDMT